jgi:hypothetical protein
MYLLWPNIGGGYILGDFFTNSSGHSVLEMGKSPVLRSFVDIQIADRQNVDTKILD